jgi:hypothetical protein
MSLAWQNTEPLTVQPQVYQGQGLQLQLVSNTSGGASAGRSNRGTGPTIGNGTTVEAYRRMSVEERRQVFDAEIAAIEAMNTLDSRRQERWDNLRRFLYLAEPPPANLQGSIPQFVSPEQQARAEAQARQRAETHAGPDSPPLEPNPLQQQLQREQDEQRRIAASPRNDPSAVREVYIQTSNGGRRVLGMASLRTMERIRELINMPNSSVRDREIQQLPYGAWVIATALMQTGRMIDVISRDDGIEVVLSERDRYDVNRPQIEQGPSEEELRRRARQRFDLEARKLLIDLEWLPGLVAGAIAGGMVITKGGPTPPNGGGPTPPAPSTGTRLHHPISIPVARAMEQHPTLGPHTRSLRGRITTSAVGPHNYDAAHRALDNEVIQWLQDPANRNATIDQFTAWLRWRYSQPDLRDRFPSGIRIRPE